MNGPTKSAKEVAPTQSEVKRPAVKKIDIDGYCSESFPCKHEVYIDGRQITMRGSDICEILRENGYKIPEHFKTYADGRPWR